MKSLVETLLVNFATIYSHFATVADTGILCVSCVCVYSFSLLLPSSQVAIIIPQSVTNQKTHHLLFPLPNHIPLV